jgi:hypothetical protein
MIVEFSDVLIEPETPTWIWASLRCASAAFQAVDSILYSISTAEISADALEKRKPSDLRIFFVAALLEIGFDCRSHCESASRISAAISWQILAPFAAVPVIVGAVRLIWLARRIVHSSKPMIFALNQVSATRTVTIEWPRLWQRHHGTY